MPSREFGFPLLFALFALLLPISLRAVEVKATAEGLAIDAGAAGVHVLKYPRLLTPNDKGLDPENIQVKPDGSGVMMAYTPGGKLTIDHQADGSWVFHLTDIPEDRVKFSFGIQFPLTVIEEGATWAFDAQSPQAFPALKDKVSLYMGNPGRFVFCKGEAGFAITYPQKTWTVFSDQRVWGKTIFGLGQILYFPGKKHVPEITYTLAIGNLTPHE